MLLSVQLDGQNRDLSPVRLHLIDHEVKSTAVEELLLGHVLVEDLRYRHLVMHHMAHLRGKHVTQRMVKALKERRLGLGAVWLDSKRAR